ncbi:DUF302 domain-containing protein [uncultured Polaribacter sp.]|uniref:DUF302 domain-containing protein n=1 Tax=uncultured Polaribacter sp. TaxID=174711 RepID=UPI0026114987|nr:DUF302 domain-containing protein [uncultured Polaribacter sp.]
MKHLTLTILICTLFMSCKTEQQNGLVTKDSPYNVEITYNKLRTIIDTNPNLKILLELDHSKNAASVDLELNSTKIIMFGNPKLGTSLMQASPTASIDLPQKIIVYTTDNKTAKIAYNNPTYLKERHNIEGKDAILLKITDALDNITNKVIE